MPKSIENYRKVVAMELESQHSQKKMFSCIPVIIVIVAGLFCINVGYDSYSHMSTIDASLSEKSKVCLVEFNQRKCDSINLAGDCKRLFDCVQLKEADGLSRIWEYGRALIDEVRSDFQFPTILIGLLLLVNLVQAIRDNKIEPREE